MYVTEASTINLKPGQWPKLIETTLGNGLPFVFQNFEGEGDSRYAEYRQDFGVMYLQVFND
jgi:hypothetical protein